MAQDRNTGAGTTPADPTQTSPEDRGGSRFHVYAGGEVKELEGTRVSPWLYGFWTIVIIGAVGYFLIGGALGPQAGMGFKPGDASTVAKTQMETELNQAKLGSYIQLDVAALPHPQGQSITQSIAAGQNVYETYCIGCHGQNRDGNGVNAASLNPKPRNLIDGPFMQSMSYQRIYTSLHKGVPGTAMPRWENTLNEKELQDVAIYVLSMTAPKPGSLAAASTTSVSAPVENTGSAPPANTGASKTPVLPKPGHPAKPGGPHKNTNGSTTNTSGGSHTYGSGATQNSPKPITPTINGNPAADTTNAPPSQSAPNSDSTPNVGANPSPTRSGAGAPIPGGTTGVMHNTPGNTVTPGAGM